MSDLASAFPGGSGSVSHISHATHGTFAGSVTSTGRMTSVPAVKAAGAFGPAPQLERPAASADRVEVSDVARFMDMLRRLPEARLERVHAARQSIEQGRYESEDVLNQTVTRLGEDLV